MRQRTIGFLTVLWLAGCSLSTAKELVLVEDGKAKAPIIVAEDAPPFTKQAADELAVYMEKISGARPDVMVGTPDPISDHAIWVGPHPALGKPLKFEYPEEILIVCDTKNLVLAGRDRWVPGGKARAEAEGAVAGVQQEYGTANAVYTFLQDYLDVRWIWPGELGEDIIEQDTIALEPFEYRYHPQIRSRRGVFTYSRLGKARGYGRSHDWTRMQRLQLDSLGSSGGHGFGNWWERFHEKHPDYFALQPDGIRSGFPSPGNAKMCLSNPGVWTQWTELVAEQLESNPAQTVFNAAENDGWASGYCICENCRAWDHPDGELRIFRWAGLAQEYVAMSDRQVTFANHLGKLLKQRYPDKQYYVSIAAYGHSRPAPLAVVPDDNVIVMSVANFLARPNCADRGSPQGTLHRDQFEGWGKVAPNLFWRPNKARSMVSMPLFPIEQTIKDMGFVAENHCIGIYIDMVWEHWATRGPLYYILGQMAWDPRQDGEKMLADYYTRGFGKAAGDVRAYWTFMEDTWKKSREDGVEMWDLFAPAFFERAYRLLEKAQHAVNNQPQKYGKRIEFVRLGLDYTRLVTEAHNLMVRFRASGETDKEAEARALKLWMEDIRNIGNDETYPYAINWGPTRPGHGHMKSGLFPKDLPRVF